MTGPPPPPPEREDVEAPSRIALKAVVFGVLLLAGMAWVSANDGDGAHTTRRFLSELFRRLF